MPGAGGRWVNVATVDTQAGIRNVAIAAFTEAGTGEAQDVSRSLLSFCNPQWMIVTGIAGGRPDKHFSLGDVVISTYIHDFTVHAVSTGSPPSYSLKGGNLHQDVKGYLANLPAAIHNFEPWNEPSNIGMGVPPLDLGHVDAYGPPEWQNDVRRSLSENFWADPKRLPRFVTGEVGSSDALIKDPTQLIPLLASARHIIAVEMEVAGAYRAALSLPNTRLLTIRGISDIIGLRRDEEWKAYACHTNAAFVHAFVRACPLRERVPCTLPPANDVPAAAEKTWNSRDTLGSPGIVLHPARADDESDDARDKFLRKTCWESFYHWNGQWAEAIRLVGTGSEVFPPGRIEIVVDDSRYVLPDSLSVGRDEIIHRVEKRAKRGPPHVNNPCVRLVDYRAAARDLDEEKYLELHLGHIVWNDWVLGNQRFDDPDNAGAMELFGTIPDIRKFIDFAALVRDKSVSESPLSNILTAYVSLTTTDGYIVYSRRSGRGVASHGNMLISAVSENLHPKFDGIFRDGDGDPLFQAASRGIREELSGDLSPRNPGESIRLLGLDFHFQSFHPGLLFFSPLPFTRDQVARYLRENPGKDFQEGSAEYVHLGDVEGLTSLLRRDDWFSAGKACVIRTLQYLTAVAEEKSVPLANVPAVLARG